MALIPPIGTVGVYSLRSPFAALLHSGVAYRCEAVRKISDLLEEGVEPYEEYYKPYNVSESSYEQDLVNQVCIVSLQSTSGHWVYVPSTYITAYPSISGVPYRVMVLGVELGPVPDYFNLDVVKDAVSNAVRDSFGVKPEIKHIAVSGVQNFSQHDHDIIEAAREQAILKSDTWKARFLQTQAALESLQQQYNALAASIIKK